MNAVKPKKTPKVINLDGYVNALSRTVEESDVQRLEDNRAIEISTQDSEGESLQKGKSGQENEVEWVLMAFPIE